MLYFVIFLIFTFVLLFLPIKITIIKDEDYFYVEAKYMLLRLSQNPTQWKEKIYELENNFNFKAFSSKMSKIKILKPIVFSIFKKTKIKVLKIIKHVSYEQIYTIITFYQINAFLFSWLENNANVKEYTCDFIYSKESKSINFNIEASINIFKILLAMISNLKIILSYFKKERFVSGS